MKYIVSIVLVCLVAITFGFKFENNKRGTKEIKSNFKTQVIRVRLDSLGTGLILDDGVSKGGKITTKVASKEIVKWKLDTDSGIESLDSIKVKTTDIFSIKPSKQTDGTLTGTVGEFPSGTQEEYGIYFTVNGTTLYHDPIIQIH